MPTSTPNILNPAAPTPSDSRTVSTRFGMIMELPEVDGDVCAPNSLLEPPVINGSRNSYKMSSNYFSSIVPANHGNGTASSSSSQASSSSRKLATVSDTLPLGASSFPEHQEPPPLAAHPPQTERHYQQLNHNPISPHRRVEEAFQEMVDEQPRERERPLIVLDCANIGWHYADHSKFSAQGVYLAITALRSLHDSDIVAFLPAAYLHRARRIQNQDGAYVEMDTDDWDQLHDLLRHNLLAIVPSGDSDDAYILEYARSHQGFVVSNDLFRDHIAGLEVTSMQLSMQLWLQENRCGYCFVGNEFYLNPQSSLSRILQQPRTRGIMLPSFDALLGQLSQCCETLYSWQRPLEMQYLLLARSRLFYEVFIPVYFSWFVLFSILHSCVSTIIDGLH